MAHRKREDLLIKFEQMDGETNSTKTKRLIKMQVLLRETKDRKLWRMITNHYLFICNTWIKQINFIV